MLMSRNTKNILPSARSSGSNPTEDSRTSISNITNWIIAGAGRRRAGRVFRPRDMLEREKKTVVW
jgi:hypothetical protein